jgi:hypothetical protein
MSQYLLKNMNTEMKNGEIFTRQISTKSMDEFMGYMKESIYDLT